MKLHSFKEARGYKLERNAGTKPGKGHDVFLREQRKEPLKTGDAVWIFNQDKFGMPVIEGMAFIVQPAASGREGEFYVRFPPNRCTNRFVERGEPQTSRMAYLERKQREWAFLNPELAKRHAPVLARRLKLP